MVSGVMYDVDSYAEYLPQFLSSGCFPPIILDPNVLALRNFLWNPAAIRDCGALLSGCDINDSTLCDLVRWLVEEEVPCCQFMISTDEIVSFDSPESGTSVGYRTGRESNGWILVPFDMMCKRTWKRTARWWGVWRPVWPVCRTYESGSLFLKTNFEGAKCSLKLLKFDVFATAFVMSDQTNS